MGTEEKNTESYQSIKLEHTVKKICSYSCCNLLVDGCEHNCHRRPTESITAIFWSILLIATVAPVGRKSFVVYSLLSRPALFSLIEHLDHSVCTDSTIWWSQGKEHRYTLLWSQSSCFVDAVLQHTSTGFTLPGFSEGSVTSSPVKSVSFFMPKKPMTADPSVLNSTLLVLNSNFPLWPVWPVWPAWPASRQARPTKSICLKAKVPDAQFWTIRPLQEQSGEWSHC